MQLLLAGGDGGACPIRGFHELRIFRDRQGKDGELFRLAMAFSLERSSRSDCSIGSISENVVSPSAFAEMSKGVVSIQPGPPWI